MSRLSIVIFGATGFTGRYAVYEVVKLSKKYPELTWGVAGRSQSKLESLIQEVSRKTGTDQSHVRVIVADVTDEQSLIDMCNQCKVVANCCGPYRLYGEPVVKAALHCKTHVVDITGEPQFIETMQLKYDEQAREAGVCIISACGFDSIPNDMGTLFLQQNFGGTLNTVESYLRSEARGLTRDVLSHGLIHSGTWHSLLHGLAHYDELKPLRMKLYPEKLPISLTPKLQKRSIVHRHAGWCVPFPGADNSVVFRSQRALYEKEGIRPAQFRAYVAFNSIFAALGIILAAIFYFIMAQWSVTRNLLLKYPRVFTLGVVSDSGPTAAVCESTKFEVELVGEGWGEGTEVTGPHNKRVVAKVSGTNPGYGATVTALLYSAITILKESDNMPDRGVLTTAVAFRKTNLIKNLTENGIKFEIVKTKDI